VALTRVSPALFQVSNNITSVTVGGSANTISLTFDSNGVITGASNNAVSVANTAITGNIISSQITSVANTQLTGLIQAAQIGSANATLITSGTLPGARLPAGSVLKVQQFTDAGSSTTSTSLVNLQANGFYYTPVSTSSTLFLTITAYAYNNPAGGYSASTYSFYGIGEYINSVWTHVSNTGYLWSNQYSTTYAQSIAASAYMTTTRSNTSLTGRFFDLMGGTTNANIPFAGTNIIFTVMEVAV